jgi:hypothetical protein
MPEPVLGWPAYGRSSDQRTPLEGRRVDFTLCPAKKPIAFIEVKQIGPGDGTERQLLEYAFPAGIPLTILTDGHEWSFFPPAKQGDCSGP